MQFNLNDLQLLSDLIGKLIVEVRNFPSLAKEESIKEKLEEVELLLEIFTLACEVPKKKKE